MLRDAEASGGSLRRFGAGELAEEEQAVEEGDGGFGVGTATVDRAGEEARRPLDPALHQLWHDAVVR